MTTINTPEYNETIKSLLKCDTFNTRIINGSDLHDISKIIYTIANNPEFNLKHINNNLSVMEFDNTDIREELLYDINKGSSTDDDDGGDDVVDDTNIKINYKLSIENFYKITYNDVSYVFYLTKEGVMPTKIKYKVDYYISLFIYYNDNYKAFEDLCIMCNKYYELNYLHHKDTDDYISIYLKNDYGFEKINSIKSKDVNTLYLPKKDILNLLKDIDIFLGSEKIYDYLDINYKRCYLFEGVWGSGKTSTIRTIASKYKYNIAIIAFDANLTDTKLFECLQGLPKKSILVLEDIDCLFKERKESDSNKNMITFSSLLNILDGMVSKRGLITIMTTNYKINLDKALIRPGRVDYILNFDFMKKSEIKLMFIRFTCLDDYTGKIQDKKKNYNIKRRQRT